MKNYLFDNFALKLIALLLAVLSWFYIMGEIESAGVSQKSIFDFTFPERYINKIVPIKINITGKPAAGYHTSLEKVVINPAYSLVVGPQSLIEHLEYILTEPVDISGATQTISKKISLQKIANQKIVTTEKAIETIIPIEKEM